MSISFAAHSKLIWLQTDEKVFNEMSNVYEMEPCTVKNFWTKQFLTYKNVFRARFLVCERLSRGRFAITNTQIQY